jgi:uncharacterized coiled-coil protein SlyX
VSHTREELLAERQADLDAQRIVVDRLEDLAAAARFTLRTKQAQMSVLTDHLARVDAEASR